ncbi:LacI family DNA-binding transcriptional regulator [Shimia abyssi]|nr:LacI family DNA-binding transcriptional regulator [Shimia abyssi]
MGKSGQPRASGKRPSSPTLEDVARMSRVSTATVSRCLNNPSQVSEATREQVLKAVNALGYAPNFGARALAAKRTNTFGAIIPTMDNAIFARGLQAFQEELGRHGVTTLVASSSYSPELEEEQIRALVARGADALLLIGHDRTEKSYAFLEQHQIPYVVAWTFNKDQARPSIGFDNRKAMASLTEHVLRQGHRRIALVSAPKSGNDRARERCDGVHDAMMANGLEPADLVVIETPYSISNGAKAFERLMEQTNRPTAVLCGNDVLAAGALTMANKLGVDVPGEVSITGFDDIEIAEIVSPALTTVHVPHRNMGAGAAKLLVGMRNGASGATRIELQADIKLRASLGPV